MKLYEEYQKISNDLDFLKFCMTKVTMSDIHRALGSDHADRFDYYLLRLVKKVNGKIIINPDTMETEGYGLMIHKLTKIVHEFFLTFGKAPENHEYTFSSVTEIYKNMEHARKLSDFDDMIFIQRKINEAYALYRDKASVTLDWSISNTIHDKLVAAGYGIITYPIIDSKHIYMITWKRKDN